MFGDQFLAAERDIAEADRQAALADDDNQLQPIHDRYDAATDFLERTEPGDLVGAVVKLRRLLAAGEPLDGYDRERDSLRQVVAFLEREIAAKHHLEAGRSPHPVEPDQVIDFGNWEPRE